MSVAPEMVPFVYCGGLLATGIIGTLLVMFIRALLDDRENRSAGQNKRLRYMIRFVYDTSTYRYINYYSTNGMKPYLQEYPKYASVMAGYPVTKQVFDDYTKLGISKLRETMLWPHQTCTLVLMEERSYFGFKAWYDLERAKVIS